MFGPNTHYEARPPRFYSHRDQGFVALLDQVRAQFKAVFQLEGWDVLFIPGPATLAMQMVIQGLAVNELKVHGQGKFAQRWRATAQQVWRRHPEPGSRIAHVYCLLETSASEVNLAYNKLPWPCVVDAVSGFPFYELPRNTAIFVTTSGKLLGAPPGVAIVGVWRDAWPMLQRSPEFLFTDLHQHRGTDSLTTLPPLVFEQLAWNLRRSFFDRQAQQIIAVSQALIAQLPPAMSLGQPVCPVITVRRDLFDARFPGVSQEFELYPGPSATDRYQIFTYSQREEDYAPFIERLANSYRDTVSFKPELRNSEN